MTLQKILGKNYKWWFLIKYSFKQSNLKFGSFLIFQIAAVLEFAITIFVWSLVNNSKENITYFFVGFLLQRLVWTQFLFELCNSITTGRIVNKLIIPSNFLIYMFFRELGSRIIPNLISAALIFSLLPFYFDKLLWPQWQFFLIIPLFLMFGFVVDFCCSFILGCVSFWTPDYRPITYLVSILFKFLAGLSIPFVYFPNFISTILKFNPYSYLNYQATQIYLGKYSPIQTLYVFLGGILWCVLLYFLAKLVFKMGLKRNESVGL